MGTLGFSTAEVGRRERDLIPRTKRTTSFWTLCEFWEDEPEAHEGKRGNWED